MNLRFIGRRLLIPLLGSSMLLAAAAGSALAKCEQPEAAAFCQDVYASVSFGGTGRISAGSVTAVTISFTRAERPVDPAAVTLVFSGASNGPIVRAEAQPTGVVGLWSADVSFPVEGIWTVSAEVDTVEGAFMGLDSSVFRVDKALTPPDPAAPVTPSTPITPATPALPIALLVAGIAAAGLAASALRGRSRRKAPAA